MPIIRYNFSFLFWFFVFKDWYLWFFSWSIFSIVVVLHWSLREIQQLPKLPQQLKEYNSVCVRVYIPIKSMVEVENRTTIFLKIYFIFLRLTFSIVLGHSIGVHRCFKLCFVKYLLINKSPVKRFLTETVMKIYILKYRILTSL